MEFLARSVYFPETIADTFRIEEQVNVMPARGAPFQLIDEFPARLIQDIGSERIARKRGQSLAGLQVQLQRGFRLSAVEPDHKLAVIERTIHAEAQFVVAGQVAIRVCFWNHRTEHLGMVEEAVRFGPGEERVRRKVGQEIGRVRIVDCGLQILFMDRIVPPPAPG